MLFSYVDNIEALCSQISVAVIWIFLNESSGGCSCFYMLFFLEGNFVSSAKMDLIVLPMSL